MSEHSSQDAVDRVIRLASDLIAAPSVTGKERLAAEVLIPALRRLGWEVETLPVSPGRDNVFVSFGVPRIVFTTHVDVVPAPSSLFTPVVRDGALYGRGACDAKGIVATMVEVGRALRQRGEQGFGLLFVVGEEVDGDGARDAATALQGRGIRYLVNGEPTEGKVLVGHKGDYIFELKCGGRAAHSGYPELGIDANACLVRVLSDLFESDLGSDPLLGVATLNAGLLSGGVAMNVVSPSATATCYVRIVTPWRQVEERVLRIVGGRAEVIPRWVRDPTHLVEVPGFATGVAAYSTDIPNFSELGAEAILYGPGSIHHAHTDGEQIKFDDIAEALAGYERIYDWLSTRVDE